MKQIMGPLTVVIALILGVVGLSLFFSAAPSLIGDILVANDDAYISNTTGCYINEPVGTPDTEVNPIYCTGLGIMPLLIIGLFIVVIVGLVIGIFTGFVKIPGLKL